MSKIKNLSREEVKKLLGEEAEKHGIDLEAKPSCGELQEELEGLWSVLEDAPTPHKKGIIKRINHVLAQMESQGC